MHTVAIVLAAGKGARFAADAGPGAPLKLLADVDGVPLLARTLQSLRDGGVDRCVVVVASDTLERLQQVIDDPQVAWVVNPDPTRGMFSSVQVGLTAAAVAPDDHLSHLSHLICLVLPGDMPFVQASTVAAVIGESRRGGRSVTPRHGGQRGHPVALSAALRAQVLAAPVTSVLRDLLAADAPVVLPVNDTGVLKDVDRPHDL